MIHFDINNLKKELESLEALTTQDGFWNDTKKSNEVISKIKNIKNKYETYNTLLEEAQNLKELSELLKIDYDENLAKDIIHNINNLQKNINKLEIETLLSEKYDKNNAIITIHPGAGGTESQDWAEMLYRMYSRWANKNNYQLKELDYLEGEEAGLKSVTFEIIGENAYGYMKCEKGVHRLVRISPFDANKRRHTSFASVEVIPSIDEDIKVEIKPEDIRIDTYRASGAGGQHINKTDSAVRITHIPTGIVVTSQSQRSQIQNRETAMLALKSKLYTIMVEQQKETINEIKGEQKNIEWGSQIRSYVFCPYTLVKDNRTDASETDVRKVMDGEIDTFINAYLKRRNK